MKNFLRIVLLPIAIITMVGSFAPTASATPVSPLSVQFVPNPLFDKPNFLPLDQTSGVITVTNNSDSTQTILTEAINIFDNDNFGSLLHLTIADGSGTLFSDSLANFFATAGEFYLGSIDSGASRSFTYTVSFIDSSDNSYQGKTLGFDVCIGFAGGAANCGTTSVGGEGGGGGGGTIPGTSEGGSGGGSISGVPSLLIFNVQAQDVSNVNESGLATITWDTNKLSTSQVVYGLASGGPYTLVLTPPNFGYPLATAEDSVKVIHHTIFLYGLVPSATYVYRVVSHASPATVSYEHQFTVPALAVASQENGQNNPSQPQQGAGGVSGEVLGASTINIGGGLSATTSTSTTATTSSGENNNLAAAASLAGFSFGSMQNMFLFILILLLIGGGVWLWRRQRSDY